MRIVVLDSTTAHRSLRIVPSLPFKWHAVYIGSRIKISDLRLSILYQDKKNILVYLRPAVR